MYRGARLYAVDAESGELVFSLKGWYQSTSSFWGGTPAIAVVIGAVAFWALRKRK